LIAQPKQADASVHETNKNLFKKLSTFDNEKWIKFRKSLAEHDDTVDDLQDELTELLHSDLHTDDLIERTTTIMTAITEAMSSAVVTCLPENWMSEKSSP
jgi:hypothetical protein